MSVCFENFEDVTGAESLRPYVSILPRVSRSAGQVVGATDRRTSDAVQAPSSFVKDTNEGQSMATPTKGQKTFPGKGNEFVDTADITEAVCGVLRATFGEDRHAAKKLARLANASTDTAKNWLSGRNPPGLTHFFRLAQRVPELRGYVCRMLAIDGDLDPEMEHELQRLQENLNRILAERRAAG